MKIVVFGATGYVGKFVVEHCLTSNHYVKAFGRNVENLIDKDLREENFEAIKGYVFDEIQVYNALKNCDAVISCLGGGYDGIDTTRSLGIKNIILQMQKAAVKRIVSIGAFGILNFDETELIFQTKDYPQEFIPVSLEHFAAYNYLKESNLDWTFICPSNILNQPFNGNYLTSLNYPTNPNKDEINVGNLVDCILKSIEENTFIKQKIAISNS